MDRISFIGQTNYQNKQVKFGIRQSDRLGHIYCIGKTGTGKSTLLLNMAVSDIENGNGIGIIDPHGDLAEEILAYVPQSRIKDVIYFNVGDSEYPISFNPLDVEGQHHLIASNLISTLKKAWSESWGPRLEHVLRFSILTLLQFPNATLLDIQPLLTHQSYRMQVLGYIRDKTLLDFWIKEFNPLSVHMKNEVVSPIINKVGLFQAHKYIRNIVGQPKSSFNIEEVMNSKKIFIANLSKGVLGEDATQLLGSLLVTQFQTASLARANQPINTRVPFCLYIDEMHSFVTLSFADILSESRKYGLSLFLTHQYIYQLHENIRHAILGNVGTIICFRIGAQDASILEEEYLPVFTKEDLVNLPQYHIYLKLLIDGTTSRPFSAVTLLNNNVRYSYQKKIIEFSQMRYSKSEKLVKENNHADLSLNPASLFDK
jgi:hypothetical protein